MRKLLLFLACLFLIYASWPIIMDSIENTKYASTFESIKSEITEVKENTNFAIAAERIISEIDRLFVNLNQAFESEIPNTELDTQPDKNQNNQPKIAPPKDHLFSIATIELGDSKEAVEILFGAEKRATYNDYGVKWFSYHKDYNNFIMIAYDQNDTVTGLYTNQNLIASATGITHGSSREMVIEKLGEPLSQIQKGLVYYQFQESQDYDVFLKEDSYVTIFYDKHENTAVTSIQIISNELEQLKEDFYVEASSPLIEGFEYQLFDLTNATRVEYGLPVLTWDDHIKETARKHSIDMALHKYFDHTNKDGQSPFDRMLEDNISFTVAGENLASGQFSSIFAHEGLMNSIGHRENILQPDFELLGVGVAFNDKAHPYYTENFYTK